MQTLLFPGWASFEYFYKKELNTDFFYVKDISKIPVDAEYNIIAWSMGTISALKFIENFKINNLILLAPTKRFTENIKEEIIDKMIDGLKINKEVTLKNFYKMNFNDIKKFRLFWNEYEEDIKKLDLAELIDGLKFLKSEQIEKMNFDNVKNIYIFYGKEDKIIPFNRENFCIGEVTAFERGHNFIYQNMELKKIVRSLLND